MTDEETKAADIEAFELFTEKANKLRKLRFVRSLQTEKSGWNLTFQNDEVTGSRHGPDNESVEAFVLTFRFFIQDNEPSSIRRMAKRYKRLYDDSLISKELLDNFNVARTKLIGYMDSNRPLVLAAPGTSSMAISRQEVFDVFMWGGLAHARNKQKFDAWQTGPMQIFFPMLENEFIMALRIYLQVISYMQGLNEQVLTKLRSVDSDA